jgi:hypothetical protein
MDSFNIVDAAIANDQEAFMNAFNAAIAPKVSDALEIKKVEIASNLLTPEEADDEIPEYEAEVDGDDESNNDESDDDSTDADDAA